MENLIDEFVNLYKEKMGFKTIHGIAYWFAFNSKLIQGVKRNWIMWNGEVEYFNWPGILTAIRF